MQDYSSRTDWAFGSQAFVRFFFTPDLSHVSLQQEKPDLVWMKD